MRESLSSAIIATNTSELLSKEIEQLKEYSRRSCLMSFGISFPKNNSSATAAATSNSVKDFLINQLQIDPEELNIKPDKVRKLPLTSAKTQYKKTVPNVICCFKSHCFREKLHVNQKMIYKRSKQTTNFHASLTNEQSTRVEKTQTYILIYISHMEDFKKHFLDVDFIVQFVNTSRVVLLRYFCLVYLFTYFLIFFRSFPNLAPLFSFGSLFELTASIGYLNKSRFIIP